MYILVLVRSKKYLKLRVNCKIKFFQLIFNSCNLKTLDWCSLQMKFINVLTLQNLDIDTKLGKGFLKILNTLWFTHKLQCFDRFERVIRIADSELPYKSFILFRFNVAYLCTIYFEFAFFFFHQLFHYLLQAQIS